MTSYIMLNVNFSKMENGMSEAKTCGCGRSPTGKCVGWHSLTEEQFAEKKAAWEAKQAEKKSQ
ncbi:MAG: hypothetical protein EBZ18_00720 [Alphaproteobacteria bacterium]|nr:hypothetical protein [Alphaproteobacteria bacterium]